MLTSHRSEPAVAAFFLLALLATVVVYWPGLGGIFLLDDNINLFRFNFFNGVTDWHSFLFFVFGNTSGALGRPVSMAAFLLDDQYWPGDPATFRYTNLMIHLLTGVFIFAFIERLLRLAKNSVPHRPWIAAFVAAIWLLHPFNVSTTLYIIQRMTQLSALFTIAALYSYIHGRERISVSPYRGLFWLSFALFPLGLLALFSKENGVLLLFYIIALEATLLNGVPRSPLFNKWLLALVAFPAAIVVSYFVIRWNGYIAGYGSRSFDLSERLLTEAHVLMNYLFHIAIPTTRGIGLIHDDFPLSMGLFSPVSTLYSLLFIGAGLMFALIFRARYPLAAFAILWFLIGHSLESSFIPLEIYFEHRNYLPMVGPLLALIYGIFYVAGKSASYPLLQKAILSLPILFTLSFGLLTSTWTPVWSNPLLLFTVWAQEHPDSQRMNRVYGQALAIGGRHEEARRVLLDAYSRWPEDIGLLLEATIASCRLREPPPATHSELLEGVRRARSNGGHVTIAKRFIKEFLDNEDCPWFSRDELHRLLDRLTHVEGMSSVGKTELLMFHADIYITERRLEPTMELMDEAAALYAHPVVPARQARILASAGLYDLALDHVETAKRLESGLSTLQPSQMAALDRLETEILARKHARGE